MRAARRIVKDEAFHVVAQLAEGRGRRGPGQAGADHNDVELALVVRIDELVMRLRVGPLLVERTGGDLGVELAHRTTPVSTAMGKEMFPSVITTAKIVANVRRQGLNF